MTSSGHDRRSGTAHGNAAVEFGLVLPLLLALLLGTIDYGYVYFTQLTITNAAREGARVGVTRFSKLDAEEAAKTAARDYLVSARLLLGGDLGNMIIATLNESAPVAMVRVNIDFPFTPLIGFIPALPDNLHASAVMRWEGPP
jgi:hypothetical protein